MHSECFFFFKQKTAYEMRISDWSSDVCSSDLLAETYVSTSFPKAMGIRHTSQLRQNWYLMGELNFDSQGPRNARYLATQQRADELIKDWQQASMQRDSMMPGGFGIKIFEAADAGQMAPELAPLLIRSFLRGGLDTTTTVNAAVLYYLAPDPPQHKNK